MLYCIGNLYERGMIAMMTIEGLIAVVSLVLTAFGPEYTRETSFSEVINHKNNRLGLDN